ncbi:MAG: YdeI/OmpD-associated family protein [Bacteroidales bacterium]|nr:YdeI/OmpD-associated family protein [Bacteroidales bacterium]
MNTQNPQYFTNRAEWRNWLNGNFDKEKETWFVFANKSSGKPTVSYNDAVEEALCFGWIDSIAKPLDNDHHMQRFTPRRVGSAYSQPNIERLIWLLQQNLVHPTLVEEMEKIVNKEFVFPADIMDAIKSDVTAWENYQHFTESYKRIRVAYIDGARKRPEEFEKRLNNFISKTREKKLIIGHGGIDKYYK